MTNVWREQEISRLRQHGEVDTLDAELAMVNAVYDRIEKDGYHKDRPCSCGRGMRQYKATIGAYKCPACGLLETASGKVLR